jgi:phage-related tail protein
LSSAFLTFGKSLGKSLSGAVNTWKTTFEKIIGVVLDFVAGLAKLAAGIGGLMVALGNPQGFAVLAAAAALQAISSGVQAGINKRASNREKRSESDAPALAEGGLAFGPTLATVGDNPGARSNPEVIAPLDKLKSMMGNLQPRQSSSGLSESSLQGAFERALSNKMSRLGPKEVFVLSQQGKRGF